MQSYYMFTMFIDNSVFKIYQLSRGLNI